MVMVALALQSALTNAFQSALTVTLQSALTDAPQSALTAVPGWIPVAVAALLAVLLPRALGHALGAAATLFAAVQAWLVPEGAYLTTTFLGFDVVLFLVDDRSRTMALIVGFLATAAVAYSWGCGIRRDAARGPATRVQTAFALSYVASTLGTVYAGDWLTLIFFWELMAVTSTLLVWYYGGAAVRAGYRYALFHGASGTVFLAAVVWHYAATGSFLFGETAGIAAGMPALLTALGVGVNCGFIGLHMWLPDTYPRPHVAASVFLSVFTTKTAVYVMARAFPEGGIWLAYMGGAMAVYGVFFALLQYDPRRLLTYHIQAQVGYMLAGVGLASVVGDVAFAGGLAHMFNNVLFKSLLFMAVGVVIYRTGEEDIRNLGGLWKEMPATFLAYVAGAASITAVPGFNGYISKGMVIDAAHEFHPGPTLFGEGALWWLLILGGVGTVMSFVKLGWYLFFHNEPEVHPADATAGQVVGMGLAATACLAIGLFPEAFFELLPFAEEWAHEVHPYSTGHLVESAALLTVGIVGFFALKGPLARIADTPDLDRIAFPAVFYGSRYLVWGVTETWAAVDRAVMRGVATAEAIGTRPQEAVRRAGFADSDEPVYLRSGIGRSVLLLTAVVAVALFVALAV